MNSDKRCRYWSLYSVYACEQFLRLVSREIAGWRMPPPFPQIECGGLQEGGKAGETRQSWPNWFIRECQQLQGQNQPGFWLVQAQWSSTGWSRQWIFRDNSWLIAEWLCLCFQIPVRWKWELSTEFSRSEALCPQVWVSSASKLRLNHSNWIGLPFHHTHRQIQFCYCEPPTHEIEAGQNHCRLLSLSDPAMCRSSICSSSCKWV